MISPAPKPAPRPIAPRSYSSIKPRTAEEIRVARRKLQGKQTPIPKKNTKRQERMTAIKRKKHAAYRRSECYKAVEYRSGGRCERIIPMVLQGNGYYPSVGIKTRCPNRRSDGLRMVHNHKTYARYGGNELPGDMELLCPSCNAAYESSKRGTRRFLGAGGR